MEKVDLEKSSGQSGQSRVFKMRTLSVVRTHTGPFLGLNIVQSSREMKESDPISTDLFKI